MKIINSKDNYLFDEPSGIGLGNFDGLHIGHMALVNTLINECRISGYKSLVYTFLKHPNNILRKKLFTPMLTTMDTKIRLLGDTPLNYLYFEYFDECFSRMDPEAFIKDILVDNLKAKLVVAGFNYRFGYMGRGDMKFMEEMGERYGFRVITILPVKVENEIVSSTVIRNYVSEGNMDRVFKLLGRHYSITGKVSTGKRIGTNIGFPTANIYPEDYLILPSEGVYATRTSLEGKLYLSVTNIGKNPTMGENCRTTVETHIIDFDENIYDKDIEVFFISKIRGECKFNNSDELATQINRDVQTARKIIY